MKFLHCIAAIFLAMVMINAAQAQSTSTTSKPKFGLFPKAQGVQRLSVFLNYNSFPLKVKEGVVDFSYIDESPRPSDLKQTINLSGTSSLNGIGIGLEWQTKRNFVYRFVYSGGNNNDKKVTGDYYSVGVGYAFGSKRFQLFPFIDFVPINGKMYFTKLKSDGYTVINNTEFFSSEISTTLVTNFRAFKPALGLNFNITKLFSLNANVGYVTRQSTNTTTVSFSEDGPLDQDGKSTTISATEKLSEPNLSFVVNGVRESKSISIFQASGLAWSIGLNFNIANNLFRD